MTMFYKEYLSDYKDNYEYSIIMIKPDGQRETFINKLKKELFKNELKIVEEVDVLLTRKNIKDLFLHSSKKYSKYLISGKVTFILVYGFLPHKKLYCIKHKLRKNYKVENKMKNLIHTTDQGNEFNLLLNAFFNNKMYGNLVDMNYIHSENSDIIDYLKYVEKNSTLKYLTININNLSVYDIYNLQKECFNRIELSFCYEINLSEFNIGIYSSKKDLDKLLSSFNSENDIYSIINKYKYSSLTFFVTKLNVTKLDIKVYKTLVKFGINKCNILFDKIIMKMHSFKLLNHLSLLGVTGCFCFSPKISLLEGELKMDLCRLLGLKKCGGSSGDAKLGEFQVSLESFL